MNLKILLPYKIFLERSDVKHVTVETSRGSFGFLPQRLDCVAILVPGILCYETEKAGWQYVAVDEGIFMKTEQRIVVSVRNAIGGADLGELKEATEREFRNLDEKEVMVRSAIARLESEFIQELKKLRKR